jgi:putative ATPase
MSNDLFAPRIPQEVANRRPLADRLRPQTLAEVTGQEHLTGEDGVLRRMIESGSLGSMIFWGPPGTGKTTVARLLSGEAGLAFEQISAIFSGVADLKKVFEARACAAWMVARHCSSSMRSIASTVLNRIAFYLSWKTAP